MSGQQQYGLARVDSDVTVTDLERIGSSLVRVLRDDDESASRELVEVMDRKRGLFDRLWPTPVERERQRLAVKSMRGQAARKAALLELYTETQLEIARKQADALVASVGVSLQAELARFAADRINEISATVNQSRRHFMATYGPEADEIENYQHRPELYEKAKDQLARQLDMQFDTLNQLLEGFVAHLQSRVVAGPARLNA